MNDLPYIEVVKDFLEDTCLELQVLQRRLNAHTFYGVKVITIPLFNQNALELRIRPEKQDFQWQAYLICPRALWEPIIICERFDSANFNIQITDRIEEIEREASERVVSARTRPEKQRYLAEVELSRINSADRYVKRLQKRETLRQICWKLNQLEKNTFSIDEVCGVLKNYFNGQITSRDQVNMLFELVNWGILESNSDGGFVPYVPFYEYLDDYQEEIKLKEFERKQSSLANKEKLLAAAIRRRARLVEELHQQDDQIKGLEEEVNSLRIDLSI